MEARDAIRAWRGQDEHQAGGHIVEIHGGVYEISQRLDLEAKDSGGPNAPVVYRAAEGQAVILTGGVRLSGEDFRRAGPEELAHLHPEARGHVRVLDLRGHPAWGSVPSGQGRYGHLAYNEHLLQLAQWPNRGFAHLAEVIDIGPTKRWLTRGQSLPDYSFDSPAGGRFTLLEPFRAKAWRDELKRTRDVRQDGYLSNDWTKDSNQVARIAEDGTFQLLDATRYGIGGVRYPGGFSDPSAEPKFLPNRRLFFTNLLCELDMPGEWYIDRQEQKLYLWPIDTKLKRARIVIPGGPVMLQTDGASHIRFQGITFENGGKLGVRITGGEGVSLAGCTFRNFTGRAIEITGGREHRVDACEISNCKTALAIRGGNLKKLERCGHTVVNTEIHRLRRKGYGGVFLYGCGIRFENNLYHTMNAAINYDGAHIGFKNNEFYNVGWEMGDWNVLYQGADKWCNGNVVENNFFHHMMEEPGRHPILAVRNDDGGTGTTYRSNLFYKTGRGAISFGGPSCHIINNIVLECPLLWWTARLPTSEQAIQREYDKIAQEFGSGRYPRGGKEDAIYNVEQVVGEQGWSRPPWSTAFPDFPKYMSENPFAQSYGSMLDNYHDAVDPDAPYRVIHIHKHWALPVGDGDESTPTMRDIPVSFKHNPPVRIDPEAVFVNPDNLDLRVKPGVQWVPGFVPCDLSKVGLFKSRYRPSPPNPTGYRAAIAQAYRSVRSTGGRYDPATAYKRYPEQPWLDEQ
ncbi:MAG: right-handed parallel beta-helix repeat-containing protein [Phycisphaeraceae bacterium]|nr:right-handed parallel beta-helix repeat-containing protein [Phycisphaeraceae bacterium]